MKTITAVFQSLIIALNTFNKGVQVVDEIADMALDITSTGKVYTKALKAEAIVENKEAFEKANALILELQSTIPSSPQ